MIAAQLRFEGVSAGYGRATVLRDIDLEIPPASVVALLGSNGAGKTTLLRVASGLMRTGAGRVLVGDRDVTRDAPSARRRHGVCLIPEGRGIFRSLTVRENLLLQIPPWEKDTSLDTALDMFPALRTRLHDTAGRLSGGQQQMVALSRAFFGSPSLVMLDEVSMGLAPIVVDEIFAALRTLAARGTALLIVEQYVNRALAVADKVYMIGHGRITFQGSAADLDQTEVMRHYLSHDLTTDHRPA
ncbi:ABC transporter ATP-binding protein [Frankia sp. AgKG'84/4]|uniref:ABC transporter ATP-binding protein n=1 Tax=Frankia sp. AgKG'84/4 TaxID=573490 RepID=UPI00200FD2AD|nr:ABC transporter ATP-binding protein [Frankia sp. AgKG'84/4]MCL9793058.1 ABC transporter ATP-binding protein [Frankia sp. AgKG'84/4]